VCYFDSVINCVKGGWLGSIVYRIVNAKILNIYNNRIKYRCYPVWKLGVLGILQRASLVVACFQQRYGSYKFIAWAGCDAMVKEV
jgi:hypothetical protein